MSQGWISLNCRLIAILSLVFNCSYTMANSKPLYNPDTDYIASFPTDDSRWAQNISGRYLDILSGGKQDILVLPFQVRDHAIDKIGRSLMTRYLVARLEEITQKNLINPSYFERIFGENNRRFSNELIDKLTRKLQVKTLITGYVGHNNHGKLSVSIRVQRSDQSNYVTKKTSYEQYDWNDIPFSHTELPSEQFKFIVDDIVNKIINRSADTQQIHFDQSKVLLKLHSSLNELLQQKSDSRITEAYYLQLIGMLHPELSERKQDRMFERSLVAISNISQSSPHVALLRARALFYLHRRPAAVDLLKNAETNEEKAFLAYINADLPTLEHYRDIIDDPVMRLMTVLETNKLHHKFKKTLDESGIVALKKLSQYWQFYFGRAYIDIDIWQIYSDMQTKVMLDTGFPVAGFSAEMLYGAIIAKKETPDEAQFSSYVITHLKKFSQTKTHELCCSGNSWEKSLSDEFELLEAVSESNVLKTVYIKKVLQGLPDAASEYVQKIEKAYAEHLNLLVLTRKVFTVQGPKLTDTQRKNGVIRKSLFQKFAGQTKYSAKLLQVQYDLIEFKPGLDAAKVGIAALTDESLIKTAISDFPPRHYWIDSMPNMLLERDLNASSEALQYTHTNFSTFEKLYDLVPPDQQKSLLDSLKSRFNGHKKKLLFLAKHSPTSGGDNKKDNLLSQALSQNSEHWEVYKNLGSKLVRQGEFDKAKDIFMRYPFFNRVSTKDRVLLSQQAYYAGSLLFWRGAYKQAKLFYKLTVSYNTYSSGELASKVRLAVLDNDFKKAAQESLQRAKRYNSSYAYRDYLAISYVQGNHQENDYLFDSLLNEPMKYHIWTAAFVGNRVKGLSNDEIIEWLKQSHIKDKKFNNLYLADRYGIMALLIDRAPNKQIVNYFNAISSKVLERDPMRHSKKLFVDMYLALKQKQFQSAQEIWNPSENNEWLRFTPLREFFPYIAYSFANAKTNQFIDDFLLNLRNEIQSFENKKGYPPAEAAFDYYLSASLLSGARNKHDEAIDYLNKAFNHRVHTDKRHLFTWYQIVEACEWLYEDSQNEKFKELALNWAKDYQVIQPWFAWAYAVEAKYTTDNKARQRALAMALYLDKYSERISHFSEQEKQTAREWLKLNNPFRNGVKKKGDEV